MQSPTTKKPGLIATLRTNIRLAHLSYATEKSYTYWVRYFIRFHVGKQPKELGGNEISEFLSYLAQTKNISPATQNQALCAIVFLFKKVLEKDPGELKNLVWAKRQEFVLTVLSLEEISAVLNNLRGIQKLIGCLLYGTGMRLSECLNLCVKDLDFQRNIIFINEPKGGRARTVPFPQFLKEPLREQLIKVKKLHDYDLQEGYGKVFLPHALEKKYPNADTQFKWQYVFPSGNRSIDPRSGVTRRHHLYGNIMQTSVSQAVRTANIPVTIKISRLGFVL